MDVNVKRENKRLKMSVHRKKTHMDCYLHFSSNHHPQTKTGIISCLRNCVGKVCDEASLTDEIKHLEEVFVQ